MDHMISFWIWPVLRVGIGRMQKWSMNHVMIARPEQSRLNYWPKVDFLASHDPNDGFAPLAAKGILAYAYTIIYARIKIINPLEHDPILSSRHSFHSTRSFWSIWTPFNGNFIFLPISSVLVFIEMMVGARGGNMGAVNVE